MKYQLSQSDIETIIFSLNTFLTSDLEELEDNDIQHNINSELCLNVLSKLSNLETNFSINEIRIISCSLELISAIIKGQLICDNEVKKECYKYIFSINKLIPIFDKEIKSYL